MMKEEYLNRSVQLETHEGMRLEGIITRWIGALDDDPVPEEIFFLDQKDKALKSFPLTEIRRIILRED